MMNFLRREDGAVALIFGLMAIPFMALVGWGVDYIRIQHVKTYLQEQVDIAALNSHVWEGRGKTAGEQWALVHAAAMDAIGRQYQGDWASNVEVFQTWHDANTVRITATADVPLAFMKLIPGIPDMQHVEVAAVSEAEQGTREYNIEVAELDYDAGDYNRIWAYCYWPNRPHNDPNLPRRTQMVPIADNGGPSGRRNEFIQDKGAAPQLPGNGAHAIEDFDLRQMYSKIMADNLQHGYDGQEEGAWRVLSGARTNSRKYLYIPPMCHSGSFLSFRLENVRFAREQHTYWDPSDSNYHRGGPANTGGDRHSGRYNYYTDSVLDRLTGIEQYEGLVHRNPAHGSADVLETVICDTRDQCDPSKRGNIIPKGTNRQKGSVNERKRANQRCEAGKYMYYGFEDRPPGLPGSNRDWQYEAWTDADFDDIRIIISCPEVVQTGDRTSRLVG